MLEDLELYNFFCKLGNNRKIGDWAIVREIVYIKGWFFKKRRQMRCFKFSGASTRL